MNRKAKNPKTALATFTLQVGIVSLLAVAVVAAGCMVSTILGFAHPESALSMLDTKRWSREVKYNIIRTYCLLFSSLFLCMVSAAFVFSQPLLFQIFSYPAMIVVDFALEMYLQNGKLFCRLNNEGVLFGSWILYCLFLGGLTSSAFLRGPKAVTSAIEIIFAFVAILVFISLNSSLNKYSSLRRYLSFAETVIFIGSIGASFWPLTSILGAISFALSFYGGLIVFPLFLLCHSQEAQQEASKGVSENLTHTHTHTHIHTHIHNRSHNQNQNQTQTQPYCALGMFVPMLLDSLSIFSRIVVLMPSK